jgi:hypothetical protein
MKNLLLFTVIALLLAACQSGPVLTPEAIAPSTWLTADEEEAFLYSISRYVCKLPKNATHATKFEARFDSAYVEAARNTELIHYYKDAVTGEVYFAVRRIAPSLKLKYTGTAGKFKPTAQDPLNGYEEVFRTWKLTPEELEPRFRELFMKFVKGEDLKPYYAMYSGNTDYIEFPDEHTRYDKALRRWVSQREDIQTIEQMKDELREKNDSIKMLQKP